MTNYWNIPEVPHKGWTLEDVYDVRDAGLPIDETEYETCMMCGNERIRFIHVVSHPNVVENFKVGCVCAEKMTNDYINPKRLEKLLRSKTRKNNSWLSKNWKVSQNGNLYKNDGDDFLLIYKDKKSNKYKIKINDHFDQMKFESIEEAKLEIQRQLRNMRDGDIFDD